MNLYRIQASGALPSGFETVAWIGAGPNGLFFSERTAQQLRTALHVNEPTAKVEQVSLRGYPDVRALNWITDEDEEFWDYDDKWTSYDED